MTFDIIIGNPPYNNDAYLDFVKYAHDKSNICSSMITPARWQAKGGKENEIFRENIVPYMSNITYYPDCGDIFDIRMKGGVAYYLIDKSINTIKMLTNKCQRVPELSEDNAKIEFSSNVFLWNSLAFSICNAVGCFNKDFKQFQSNWEAKHGNYNVFIATVNADAGGKTSFHIFSNEGNMTVLAPTEITNEKTFITPDIQCIFTSETLEEAENFVSWIETKLIRFLILMRVCSYHNNNDFTWGFVPYQTEFNHKYSDSEMYNKYSLNDNQINLIEKVIKGR